MRSRTDARRQHILNQAAAVFRETGYERASMAQIAARVGGSKTTLYGYFKSKQALFVSVMMDAMAAQSDALIALIDPATDDPRAALLAFGHAYLDLVLAPEIIEVTRIGVAESDTDGFGATLYEMGPRQGWAVIAAHLQDWIDRGLLRPAPAQTVALHLRGLLEAGVVEPRVYGAEPAFTQADAVENAVDVFLRAYAM